MIIAAFAAIALPLFDNTALAAIAAIAAGTVDEIRHNALAIPNEHKYTNLAINFELDAP
jgi:hypothetical protein